LAVLTPLQWGFRRSWDGLDTGPDSIGHCFYLILPKGDSPMQALDRYTAIASTPRPYLNHVPGLERQSETFMFVVRNGSRSLAQVAAQQKE
jgi:hypothetical protein